MTGVTLSRKTVELLVQRYLDDKYFGLMRKAGLIAASLQEDLDRFEQEQADRERVETQPGMHKHVPAGGPIPEHLVEAGTFVKCGKRETVDGTKEEAQAADALGLPLVGEKRIGPVLGHKVLVCTGSHVNDEGMWIDWCADDANHVTGADLLARWLERKVYEDPYDLVNAPDRFMILKGILRAERDGRKAVEHYRDDLKRQRDEALAENARLREENERVQREAARMIREAEARTLGCFRLPEFRTSREEECVGSIAGKLRYMALSYERNIGDIDAFHVLEFFRRLADAIERGPIEGDGVTVMRDMAIESGPRAPTRGRCGECAHWTEVMDGARKGTCAAGLCDNDGRVARTHANTPCAQPKSLWEARAKQEEDTDASS